MATCPVQWWTVPKGGDPRTDHAIKGTTRTPGWHPEEKEAQLPLVSKRYSQTSVGSAQKGGGPKTPVCEGEGIRGPWRCGATPPCAGCRGNCWSFMGGRSHASARSSPLSHSWTSPSRTFPPRPAAWFFLRDPFSELYMAWLGLLFICQLRPLDAWPAFLRERGLRRNVWETTLDLFSYSAPEKCDSGFFMVSALRRYAWFECGYKFCVSRSLLNGLVA